MRRLLLCVPFVWTIGPCCGGCAVRYLPPESPTPASGPAPIASSAAAEAVTAPVRLSPSTLQVEQYTTLWKARVARRNSLDLAALSRRIAVLDHEVTTTESGFDLTIHYAVYFTANGERPFEGDDCGDWRVLKKVDPRCARQGWATAAPVSDTFPIFAEGEHGDGWLTADDYEAMASKGREIARKVVFPKLRFHDAIEAERALTRACKGELSNVPRVVVTRGGTPWLAALVVAEEGEVRDGPLVCGIDLSRKGSGPVVDFSPGPDTFQ